MERCNRIAHRVYPNGYRVCRDHAWMHDERATLYPDIQGPCDYPLDGKGAMRYDQRMREALASKA